MDGGMKNRAHPLPLGFWLALVLAVIAFIFDSISSFSDYAWKEAGEYGLGICYPAISKPAFIKFTTERILLVLGGISLFAFILWLHRRESR